MATERHDWEARENSIRKFAGQPEDVFAALPELMVGTRGGLSALAAEVLYVMGYPHNARALPLLISAASDANWPGAPSSLDALQAMPPEAIAPFVVAFLWDKAKSSSWRKQTIIDMCVVLYELYERGNATAVFCGPAVASILSSPEISDEEVLGYLLGALEVIGPECAQYATPALITLLERTPYVALHQRVNKLLATFAPEALIPYQQILPTKLTDPQNEELAQPNHTDDM